MEADYRQADALPKGAEILSFPEGEVDYQTIASGMAEVAGADWVLFCLCGADGQVVARSAAGRIGAPAPAALPSGPDGGGLSVMPPANLTWLQGQEDGELEFDSLIRREGLAADAISELYRLSGRAAFYWFSVRRQAELLGGFLLAVPRGAPAPAAAAIAAYLNCTKSVLLCCRAEQTLRKRERQFWRAVENMSDFVAIVNPRGICEFVTPSVEMVTGLRPEEVIGKSVYDFVHPDDLSQAAALAETVTETRGPARSEVRFRGKDGRCFWLEVLAKLYRDESGSMAGMVVSSRDITRRKQEEAERRLWEERLHFALSDTKSGVWEWNARTGKVYLTRLEKELFGLTGDDLRQYRRAWIKCLHPDDKARVFAALNDHFTGVSAAYECEYRALLPSGECRWILDRGRVVARGDDGRPLQMIGAFVDITELKAAELRLQQANDDYQAVNSELAASNMRLLTAEEMLTKQLVLSRQIQRELSESEARYRALSDAAFEAVFIEEEREGKWFIVDANKAAVEIFGYTRQELVGQPYGELFIPGSRAKVASMVSAGRTDVYEAYGRRKDGSAFPAEIRGNTIVVDGRQIRISAVRDSTERKQAEAALRRREEEFRVLADNVPDVIIRFDRDLRCLYINLAIEKELEVPLPRAKLIGKTMHEIGISKPNADKLEAAVRQVFANGQEGSLFYDYIFPGRESYYHARAVPEFGADGRVETVLSITRNITAQKKAEKALRESEWHYRSLVENVPGAIYRFTGNSVGGAAFFSEEFGNICGYSIADLSSGRVDWHKDIVHPADREMVAADHRQLFAKPSRHSDECRIVHADGSIRWVQYTAQSIWDKGNLLWVDGVVMDITDRKAAEEEIRYLTFHDRLTGLYNRNYFEAELHRLDTARQLPLAVIIGDLNGLKLVNDSYGHGEGDRLLREAAAALQASCRREDIICRWGGDEFAILLPNTAEATAEAVCARIRAECDRRGAACPLPISIALGCAVRTDMQQSLIEIIKEAEDRMYRRKLLEGKNVRSFLLTSLQKSLGIKTRETQEHTERLKEKAAALGRSAGLPAGDLDKLMLLVTVHDIGKITVPDRILDKPGPLNEAEWEIIRKHCEHGFRIAQSSPDLAYMAEEILSHHEWYDGSGYPQGLKGEEIPLLARILSIIDAYDVMTNGRPYRKPIPPAEALAELVRYAGRQFDPDLVRLFAAKEADQSGQTGEKCS